MVSVESSSLVSKLNLIDLSLRRDIGLRETGRVIFMIRKEYRLLLCHQPNQRCGYLLIF